MRYKIWFEHSFKTSYLDQFWIIYKSIVKLNYRWGKISLQTSLVRTSSNSTNIFLLDVNFKNLTVGLYILIISSMFTKFQEDQRSIAMSSIE